MVFAPVCDLLTVTFFFHFRFETKEATNSTDSEAKAGSPVKSGMTDAEKAAARAARFGASIDVASDAKKQARAERFGTSKSTKIGAAPSVDLDTLKKRAERFGQSSATVMKKAEADEKLKKRQERFGVVAPEKKKMKKDDILASVGINATLKDEKLLKRAERFGLSKA